MRDMCSVSHSKELSLKHSNKYTTTSTSIYL